MVWTSAYEPIEAGDATLHDVDRWRSPAPWAIASRSSTASSGAAVTYADAGRAHRARRGGARGTRARRRRRARHLGAQLARVGHRRARGDGGGRDGHRGQPGRHRARAGGAAGMDCEASILATVPARLSAAREVAEMAGVRDVVALGEVEGEGRGPGGRARPGARGRTAALLERHHRPAQRRHAHARATSSLPQRQARSTLRPNPRDTADRDRALRSRHGVRRHAVLRADLGRRGRDRAALRVRALRRAASSATGPPVLIGPPPVLAALAAHPAVDAHDLSSVELVVVRRRAGGARRPRARWASACPASSSPRLRAHRDQPRWSPRPTARWPSLPARWGERCPGPSCAWSIRRRGADLGPGEPGELWMRGPADHGRLPAIARTPTAAMIDADGWLRTGDLVVVDDDGEVFIVDRLKELIKVNGLQVAPAELEALLATHPAVADAAVISRPDARSRRGLRSPSWSPREALDADDAHGVGGAARRAATSASARSASPRRYPRTPSGKILRRVLARTGPPDGVSAGRYSSRHTAWWQ